METLRPFIGYSQRKTVFELFNSEERQYFVDLMAGLAALVSTMPKTYEQDGKGDDAIASLHYFTGSCDWWITEKDIGAPEEPGQHQAFGLASLNGGEPELGYISIVELLTNGAELDFHFSPKRIGDILDKVAA